MGWVGVSDVVWMYPLVCGARLVWVCDCDWQIGWAPLWRELCWCVAMWVLFLFVLCQWLLVLLVIALHFLAWRDMICNESSKKP